VDTVAAAAVAAADVENAGKPAFVVSPNYQPKSKRVQPMAAPVLFKFD